MQKQTKIKNLFMSYQDRLHGYEQDKAKLLSSAAYLSAEEFAKRLKDLQDKWRI